MTEKPNSRSLEDIAAKINSLHRAKLFDIGDLLIEARAKCKHGKWLPWLAEEFDWSTSTASNYTAAAEIAAKFPKIRNLRVPAKVIYYHLDGEEDEVVRDAIERLETATKQGRVTIEMGEEIVDLARLRYEHGDLPDATLRAVEWCDDVEIVEALIKAKPCTKEEAEAIIEGFERADDADEVDEDDGGDEGHEDNKVSEDDDIEAILDGPPPELPPTRSPSPKTQKFDTVEAKSAWVDDLNGVITTINILKTKSLKEFQGIAFDRDDLIAAAAFISQVAGVDQTASERIHDLKRLNLALTNEVEELKVETGNLRQQLEVFRSPVRCEFVEDDGGRKDAGYAGEDEGDCVARAIAIATGKPYSDVFKALEEGGARYVKRLRLGSDARRREERRRSEPVHNGCSEKVFGPYLRSLGWQYTRVRERLCLRAGALPSGRLIVDVDRHLVALIDGVIHDTYDSGGTGRRPVKGYWSQLLAAPPLQPSHSDEQSLDTTTEISGQE